MWYTVCINDLLYIPRYNIACMYAFMSSFICLLGHSYTNICTYIHIRLLYTGEGEPTDNAIEFYKWIKNADSTLTSTTLSKLSFSVFGLG